MNPDIATVLFFVAALQLKHVICDGPLQTLGMVQAKRVYLKPLGLAHAAIHASGTFLVVVAFGVPVGFAAQLAVLDGVLHYHADFAKENTVKHFGWTVADGPFWWALTLDQALHHATYLMLAWLVFRSS